MFYLFYLFVHFYLCLIYFQLLLFMFFSSSLLTWFFIMELQWMVLLILFLIGNSIWRGCLTYLLMNSIISVFLFIGILMSNSLIFLLSCFGKIGNFPLFCVIAYFYFCASYIFLIYDIISKFSYFLSIFVILNHSIFFHSYDYWFLFINFLFIQLFIKFLFSIKHLILISSILLFLIVYLFILIEDSLFYITFLFIYLINTIVFLYYVSIIYC